LGSSTKRNENNYAAITSALRLIQASLDHSSIRNTIPNNMASALTPSALWCNTIVSIWIGGTTLISSMLVKGRALTNPPPPHHHS
jgi:hypothetical protein